MLSQIVQASVNSENSWQLVKSAENIQTYTISTEANDIVKAKAIAVFDATVSEVQAILNQVDERHLWVPYLLNSLVINKINKLQRIEYALFAAPWPASDRDFVYSHDIQVTENGSVLYKMKSVVLADAKENSGVVRGEIIESSYRLTSIDKNKTKIELIYHVDPKGWLPSWIVNIIQRTLPYRILHNLKLRIAENKASE